MLYVMQRRRLNTRMTDLHATFGRLRLCLECQKTYLMDIQQAQWFAWAPTNFLLAQSLHKSRSTTAPKTTEIHTLLNKGLYRSKLETYC